MATVSGLQHRVSQMRCGKAETFNLSDLRKDVVSLGGTVEDVLRWLNYNQFRRCPGIKKVCPIDFGQSLVAVQKDGKTVLIHAHHQNGDQLIACRQVAALIVRYQPPQV